MPGRQCLYRAEGKAAAAGVTARTPYPAPEIKQPGPDKMPLRTPHPEVAVSLLRIQPLPAPDTDNPVNIRLQLRRVGGVSVAGVTGLRRHDSEKSALLLRWCMAQGITGIFGQFRGIHDGRIHSDDLFFKLKAVTCPQRTYFRCCCLISLSYMTEDNKKSRRVSPLKNTAGPCCALQRMSGGKNG